MAVNDPNSIPSGADVLLSGGLRSPGSSELPLSQRIRRGVSALTDSQRYMILAGFIGVVVLGFVFAALVNREEKFRTLYTNLSDQDGAAIIAALDQRGIPYELTAGGAAIAVPENLVYETRLKLAGDGLPKAATVGFEILDNQKFGTSQFVEQINYVRALEGELAKSIRSIEQVKSARVHLAIPKQTAFAREQENPTGSVVVALFPGRLLDNAQTAAIARLVSSAVPRLKTQDVSIVDTEGNLLSPQQRDPDGLDGTQLKYVREFERVLAQRIMGILEPIAGKEGVRAQVTAELDFNQRETTSESFGKNAQPEGQSIRSEQSIESRGESKGVGGVPGALTNQPPAPPEAPIVEQINAEGRTNDGELQAPGDIDVNAGKQDQPGFRREKTTNFEVDRVIESLKQSKGRIQKISAAVILDNKLLPAAPGAAQARVPFTANELANINNLVRDAIGFSAERGDRVSVANIPFSAAPAEIEDQPMLSPELLREIMLYVAIVAAVLFSYFTIIRPLIYGVDLAEKKRLEEEVKAVQIEAEEARNNFSVTIDKSQREIERLQQEAKRASEARDAEENVRREAAMTDKQRYENLLSEVKTYAASNPEDMAVLAKAWLSEDTPPPDTTSKKRGFA